MELIPIIQTSLIIFASITFIYLVISYTMYKVKNRNKPVKKYQVKEVERKPVRQVYHQANVEQVNHIPENALRVHKAPQKIYQEQGNFVDNRVNYQPRTPERFKVVNNNYNPYNEPYFVRPAYRPQPAYSGASQNIYDNYSYARTEPMYKMKL